MATFQTELTVTLAAHMTVSVLTLASHASHLINVAKVAKASAHTKLLAAFHGKLVAGVHAIQDHSHRLAHWSAKHLEGLVYYRHEYETALVLTFIMLAMGELTRAAIMGTWLYAFAEALVTGREA